MKMKGDSVNNFGIFAWGILCQLTQSDFEIP